MPAKTNYNVNGKEYYRVSLELGRDSNGKRKTKFFTGKNKKEAEQKKQDFIKKMNSGIIDTKTRWLGETMKVWLFEVIKMGQIKPTSFARYEGIFSNYIETSPIACISLDKLQPISIQRYYNALYKEGKSNSQIKNCNKLLKQFLNYAVDSNYIIKNPCDGKKVIIPKDNAIDEYSKDIPVFTDDELKKIIHASEDSKIKYIALFSLATGMRKGEILGLKESDIDYKNNELTISRTVVTSPIFDENNKKTKKTFIQTPKTQNSLRILPLPKSVVPLIKKAFLLQKQDIIKAGNSYKKENLGFIFLSELGCLINASNIDKSWIYFLKRIGIKHKKFHALRHTYATKQFESNIPLKTISELLGHSSIEITANTYTHVLKKEKEKMVDILNIL